MFFPEDLERSEARLNLFARIQKRGLVVDLLVNNAGLAHFAPLDEASFGVTSAMLDLNVHALTHLTRLFLPGCLNASRAGS